MPDFNAKNERIKKEYFRFLKEADQKSDGTIDSVRKAISRFEEYTGFKDLATFNKEQAIGFKKHLARTRCARTGEPMALSTMLATTNALKDALRWISSQPRYKSRIRPTDISYLNLSENDTRAAKQPAPKKFPTVQQIEAAIRSMPAETEVEQRDRAIVTLVFLTGARDGALSSLRLKHIDLERKLVMQDPREVRTKRRKRIDTFLCPMGQEFERIVFDWVRYLREQKLYGNDDPLFPRTRVLPSADGSFAASGLEPIAFWAPIRGPDWVPIDRKSPCGQILIKGRRVTAEK
jgi:integrase/recombinase XerD